MELIKEKERLEKMSIEELFEISRKRGIYNDISMNKEDLIALILSYDIEEDAGASPDENDFSAKNKSCDDKSD
jgi:hypothetical protein